MRPSDFPLCWPEGRERTPAKERVDSRFKVPFEKAYDDLFAVAKRLHTDDYEFIISTNVPLDKKGLPLVKASEHHGDPGVAVFVWREGKPYAFTCDTYKEVRHNLRAVWVEISDLLARQAHEKHKVGRVAFDMRAYRTEIEAPVTGPAPKLLRSAELK